MRHNIVKKVFKFFRKNFRKEIKRIDDIDLHVRSLVGEKSYKDKDILFVSVFNIVKIRRGIDKCEAYERLIFDLEENIHLIKEINSRWLVSILDTIADCDKSNRSSKSLIISVFINMFKVVETRRKLAWFGEFSFFKLSFQKGRVVSWDGMTYYRVVSGDLLVNMINRIEKEVEDDILLHEIWINLLSKLKYENRSFSEMVSLNSLLEKKVDKL